MIDSSEKRRKVLVVDDDIGILYSLKAILEDKFSVFIARSAQEAMEIIKKNTNGNKCIIDFLFSDVRMDEVDGLELLKIVKSDNPEIDVIMMTGFPSSDVIIKALRFGATDFVLKPFRKEDIWGTMQRVADKREKALHSQELVDAMRKAVAENYEQTTKSLILTIDAKDNYTKEHSQRVATLISEFGKFLRLQPDVLSRLYKVALLHDIGKIGVRESILNKPGSLNPEEWKEIQRHPVIGYRIIQPVSFLGEERRAILYHHERYDGNGYPDGLKGEGIPYVARILTIVDSFDAMVTKRPYRNALTIEEVIKEIERNVEKQFDPKLAKLFIKFIRQFIRRKRTFRKMERMETR